MKMRHFLESPLWFSIYKSLYDSVPSVLYQILFIVSCRKRKKTKKGGGF